MKCTKVREKLASYHDGLLTPAERLKIKQHLEECQSCFQLYAEMQQYANFIRGLHRTYSLDEQTPEIQSIEQNIMNQISLLKEQETSWSRFWNSRPALYLSYSTAAIFFVFIVSLVINTYIFDDNTLTNNTSAALSENLNTDNYNPTQTLGENYQDSVVASPVQTPSSPHAYTFELKNNRMVTIYQQNGQQMQRINDINFRELQEIFGRIAIEYGLYESNICPECAEDYFKSVLNNDYLSGSPLKDQARQYLSQFVSNE